MLYGAAGELHEPGAGRDEPVHERAHDSSRVHEDSVLARIAHELYEQIRKDVTVDWKLKEQARDRTMARVLRLLRKHGYPPDKQPAAIERVLKQAEDLAEAMA